MRLGSGERFRKATTAEKRWGAGFFLFLPIFLLSFPDLGHSFLDRAGAVGIWFYMMGGAMILLVTLFLWARYIPATVSAVLGVIVWAVVIWMSFAGKLGP